jgi:hypothetical protein
MEARAPGGGDGGKQSAKERIIELGIKAYKDNHGNYKTMSELFQILLLTDENPSLQWEFFYAHYPERFSKLYAEVAKLIRDGKKTEPPKSDPKPERKAEADEPGAEDLEEDTFDEEPEVEPEPTAEPKSRYREPKESKVRQDERGKAAKDALLVIFKITLPDGTVQQLGTSTKRQAMSWVNRIRKQIGIDTRFVELLAAPMQEDMQFFDCYPDNEEVHKVYQLAAEGNNNE